MGEKELDKVTAFDTLFTTNKIQMCKVLLSYLPTSSQKTLAVYIKLSELAYTISFFREHPDACLPGISSDHFSDSPAKSNEDFPHICDELMPYLSPGEQDRIRQMKNMMQSFQHMQEMMEMMQMMKELFPETESASPEGNEGNGADANILSALTGMSGMNIDPSIIAQIMQMMNGTPFSSAETSTEQTEETPAKQAESTPDDSDSSDSSTPDPIN